MKCLVTIAHKKNPYITSAYTVNFMSDNFETVSKLYAVRMAAESNLNILSIEKLRGDCDVDISAFEALRLLDYKYKQYKKGQRRKLINKIRRIFHV